MELKLIVKYLNEIYGLLKSNKTEEIINILKDINNNIIELNKNIKNPYGLKESTDLDIDIPKEITSSTGTTATVETPTDLSAEDWL